MQRLIDADAYEHAVQGNPYVSDSMKTYVRCSIQSQRTIEAVPKEKILLFLNLANEELSKAHADKNVNGIMTWSASVTTLEGLLKEYDTADNDIVPVIRCKDCKHRPHKTKDGYTRSPRVQVGVYSWGEPEYDDDMTCPYVCEDTWYSCVPDDEQYCDRAEPKETNNDH